MKQKNCTYYIRHKTSTQHKSGELITKYFILISLIVLMEATLTYVAIGVTLVLADKVCKSFTGKSFPKSKKSPR